jgi:hypothetical protein
MQQSNTASAPSSEPARIKIARGITLWFLLFLICFGLGYPTLNRYDPRTVGGTSDTAWYYDLVTRGPRAAELGMRVRLLVPYLAKPFYWLAKGRFGTWEPVFFGLLVANALLVATTAYFLVLVGHRQVGDYGTALLGAALYLLNFDIANVRLSGLVDSGEGCFLMLVAWTLLSGRWWLLPLWGVLGTLAKESFVPLSMAFGVTWWLVSARRNSNRISRGLWVAAMAITALVTMTAVQSIATGHTVWPWEFAAAMNSRSNYAANFVRSLLDRNFWYIFGWLLPLGVWRLRCLPRAWVLASASAAFLALLMNAYYGGQPGTVGRAIFSIGGPILSLSVAILLCRPADAFNTKITRA